MAIRGALVKFFFVYLLNFSSFFPSFSVLSETGAWRGDLILILDDASLKVINAAMGMYKLMQNKVYLVEQITKARAPYRKSAPIYFLSPKEDSIDRLIQDWTPSKKRKEPLYADSVFLFFTSALSDELFRKIKNCKPLVKRLSAFCEINVDFIPSQARAFHFNMNNPRYFAELYRNPVADGESSVELMIANKLVTVCASLNEYPHIRYRASSRVSKSIARIFSRQFTEFIGKNKSWWYHGDSDHTDRGRATLMILSRSDDCLSPLLHEFTYQAMVNDLLELEGDKITYKAQTSGTAADTGNANATMDQDALLNDNDELWVELRGKHIADVIQILSTRIRDIVNSNTAVALNAKSQQAKALTLSQMAKALKALPEYREVMGKLTQHMNISHQCMSIFKKTNLLDISDLEQTLATGKTDANKAMKLNDMLDLVEQQLKKIPDSLTRFRLLATFIISQEGLKPSDYDRLLSYAKLSSSESKALNNLEVLGLPLVKSESRKSGSFGGEKLVQRRAIVDSGSEYSSSRYACDLKDILLKMREKTLSFDEYPSVFPMPDEGSSTGSTMVSGGVGSVRASSSKYSSKNNSRFSMVKSSNVAKKFSGARQMIFIAGGACFSELLAAEQMMEDGGSEVILGSTHFCNPEQFVEMLRYL